VHVGRDLNAAADHPRVYRLVVPAEADIVIADKPLSNGQSSLAPPGGDSIRSATIRPTITAERMTDDGR
jgi:hypothetical protein